MNLNALMAKKTFCYLIQPDFMDAFNQNQTVMLAKDFQKFQIILDENPPAILIAGTEVRPVKFLVVNNENESFNSISEEDIAKLNDDVKELFDDLGEGQFESRTKFKKTDEIVLFRRKLSSKSLNEHDSSELEEIASKVLKNNRYKGKSKFHVVNENNLLLDSDYSDPAFVKLEQPTDVDYEENYSIEPPSVHDLFDMDVLPFDDSQKESYVEEEDQDMIEEYIIEEICEEDELMAM